MPLNFWKNGADDGTDTAAAIQPVVNGEPVEQTYLNRAAQNLRTRTEDVRVTLDNLQAISRSDRAFAMFAQPDTKIVLDDTGSGEYRFTVNDTGTPGTSNRDLLITPMLSPSKVTATAAVVARFYYQADATPNGLTVDLDDVSGHPRKVAEGAHNIYLQIIHDDAISGTPVVEIKANNPAAPDPEDGPVYIIVKIEDGVTTLTDIDSAIDASAAGSLVTASVVGTGTTVVDTSGTAWGPFRAYETDEGDSEAVTPYGARAGVDDEGYLITAATLNTLFATRVMKDGDTLFLDFSSATTRMEQVATATVPVGSLHIISSDERLGTDTRNLGDADGPIPLFKVTIAPGSGGVATLVGLNQRAYVIDVPGYVLDSAYASAKSTANFSLAEGTTESQLSGVLSEMEAHVGGTGEHSIADIKGAPFVIVDPVAGNGDYQTISAAVAANRTTGATILVRPGTYAESIRSAALGGNCTGNFKIIGDGSVTITSDGSNPMIDVDTTYTFTGLWSITGVTFSQSNSGVGYVSFTAYQDGGYSTGLVFRDCEFKSLTTLGATNWVSQGHNKVMFSKCAFVGYDNDDGSTVFLLDSSTYTAVQLAITECSFYKCDRLMYGDVAGNGARNVQFSHNVVDECGSSTDAATPGQLFHLDTLGKTQAVDVSNNSFIAVGSSNEGTTIGLIKADSVSVCNNYFSNPVFDAVATPTGVGLDVYGHAAVVSGNKFYRLGNVDIGLRVVGTVSDNYFDGGCWDPTGSPTNKTLVYLDDARFHGNTVKDQTAVTQSIAAPLITCNASAGPVFVTSNEILGAPVWVAAGKCTVSENYFSSSVDADVAAIVVDGDGNTIANNTGQYRFLSVDGSYNTVVGNSVNYPSTPTGSFDAILLTINAEYNTVSGNTLKGTNTSGYYGVAVSGKYNSVEGNSIYHFDIGVSVSDSDNTVTSNHIYALTTAICVSLSSGAVRTVINGNKFFVVGGSGVYLPSASLYAVVASNHFYVSGAGKGISHSGATASYSGISGNTFQLGLTGGVGIDISHTSGPNNRYVTINGNTLYGVSGAVGVDLQYCNVVAMSGNLFGGAMTVWDSTNAGSDIGLGNITGMTANIDTYNMYP